MKKFLSVIIFLCLVWSCFASAVLADDTDPAAAGTQPEDALGDQAAAHGVDLVIVLDMTNSMDSRNNPNDKHNYRLDAAAMLIGMLDMDGSRVAVVPFAKQVFTFKKAEEDLTTLTDVSNPDVRSKIVSTMYGWKTDGGTNTGLALIKALQILDGRGDSNNDPMIVLLTDGINEIDEQNNDISEPYIVDTENWEIRRQVGGTSSQKWTAHDADVQAKNATDYAAKRGYPIYTVALNTENKEYTPVDGYSLYTISEKTGGESFKLEADNANQLPERFAEILADRIGSSVQMTMVPTYNDVTGRYEVVIPIVNESIKETNVVIMIKPLNEDDKEVIIPNTFEVEVNGRPANGDSWKTLKAEDSKGKTIGHYVMIKIQPNGQTGKWVLSYKSNSDELNDLTFNILYNYDIKLDARLTARYQDQVFYKNDTLHVEAFFRKADESGTISGDTNLYADHSAAYEGSGYGKEVYNISAGYELYRWDSTRQKITGNPLIQKIPGETEDGMQRGTTSFYEDIDLKADGMPALKTGEYAFVITATGAGLNRKCTIPFQIVNREPQPTGYVTDGTYTEQNAVEVNKSDEDIGGPSWTIDGTSGKLSRKASEIIGDEDSPVDKIDFYDIRPVDGVDQAVTMSLDPTDKDTILFTTKMDGDRIKDGTAEYWLYYDDGDGLNEGDNQRVKLVMTIASDIKKVQAEYIPVLKIFDDAGNETSEFRKNKPVTIKIGLSKKDEAGQPTGDYDIELLKKLNPVVTVKNGTETIGFAADEPEEDGAFLVYTIDSTGNKSATWNITLNVMAFDPVEEMISIPNNDAPKPKTTETTDIDLYWGRNWKMPLAGGIFHDNTLEEDSEALMVTSEDGLTEDKQSKQKGILTITVNDDMFKDADGDVLTYGRPKFYDKDGEEIDPARISVEVIEEETDDNGNIRSGKYRIKYSAEDTGFFFDWSFDAEMKITATDGDGKKGEYVQKFTVTNVRNQEKLVNLAVLAFVIFLVILILSVHQARKPKFPTLNLTIREEPSLFTSSSETLSPVKTPTNVNAMGVDGDMAARHNISMDMLQNIMIRPIRSQSAVGVVCKKAVGGHEITLEDVAMKPKKQYTWRLEEELIIRNINGEGMVAIKLEDRRGDNDDGDIPGGMDFGESDVWVDSNTGFGDTTYSGGKHTRRVKKKAAPAEEDQSFNSGNDGFDF